MMIKLERDSKLNLIANYLKRNPNATAAEIAKGITRNRGISQHEVSGICSSHKDLFLTTQRVYNGKNTYNLNDGVEIIT